MKKLFHYFFIVQIGMVMSLQSLDPKINVLHENHNVIKGLEPAILWHYFCEIAQIPHSSGNEFGLASFIMKCAQQHGLSARLDGVGNVIVKKPASSDRYAQASSVVIQAHMDMVCEKNAHVHHDFNTDPITFALKDSMLYAQETTLGADNGIGVAAALAVMSSKKLRHGPLEFLFTVMEETSFAGAYAITPDSCDSRMLINIDTEEDGAIFIGCAGNAEVTGILPIAREDVSPDTICYTITINNLRGGHSGGDIDKGRINALKLAGEMLDAFSDFDIRLISLQGGNSLTAIPRDIEVIFAVSSDHKKDVAKQALKIRLSLLEKYRAMEHNLTITINEHVAQNKKVITRTDQSLILKLLNTMPHGIVSMSSMLPGLVETSTNFARITTGEKTISFDTFQRGMIPEKLDAIIQEVSLCIQEVGAQVVMGSRDPEWQPNEDSQLLQLACKTYLTKFGKEVVLKAGHGSLECSVFVRQVPGLDAISFGPTIIDAHSPNEHVAVATVLPFWLFLTGLLEDIPHSQ